LHAIVYRATGGLVGRRLVANPMLLLTTRGSRSGEEHTVPLLYLEDESRLVVIASYGGRPHHPAWYRNLVKTPRVRVQIGGKRREMKARTATAKERALWWPTVLDAYDGYRTYQSRTDREIPVVFLDPVE
jgi:deazaflavin-dependent oxidoreductase (nitroreductase family)